MVTGARYHICVLLFLAVTGTAPVCWAHAILMDSSPKANSAVSGSDLAINLRFNARIDGARSRIRLVAPDGRTSTLTLGTQSAPNTLRSHVAGLKPGAYKLEWQVLATDGHMSGGKILFTVN
jgi:methionine-rich copper-binding protein CopC